MVKTERDDNISQNSKSVCNFVRNRKSNLISIFHSKCCLCGFNLFQEALEFHHVDNTTKAFLLASNVMKALDKQINEARKCVLLCANCHRGVHAGYYTIPDDYTKFFDEDIAQQLLLENEELKHSRKVYCKQCGKIISKGRNKTFLCQECYNKYRQQFPPNIRPPRIVLKHLIRKFPMIMIGRMYHVTDNTIRKWCKAVDLPYKTHIIHSIPDEVWEQI